jgi:hypothetical protein
MATPASENDSKIVLMLISSLTGGFIAFVTAVLVEPIKLRIAERHNRTQLWTALYRELAANYSVVEDLLTGQTNPGSPAPAYICKTMLYTECYQAAQSQPLVFRREETAHWFEVIYRSFPEWKELTDGDTIRYYFTSWYHGVRGDLRRNRALKRGLKHYLSKDERKALKLDMPPPSGLA